MFLITNVTSVLVNIVVTNVLIFVENQNMLCKTVTPQNTGPEGLE